MESNSPVAMRASAVSSEWQEKPRRLTTPSFFACHKIVDAKRGRGRASVPTIFGSPWGERRCVGPEVEPASALYSCIPIGMHGPTCIFWANLTPFALIGTPRSPRGAATGRGQPRTWRKTSMAPPGAIT
jgi:hypothetical protein